MSGKRILITIAALMMATACATPPTKNVAAPQIPTPATSSSTITSTSTSTPTPTAVPPVAVPVDLAGKSFTAVDQQLRALGFSIIRAMGPDGTAVGMDPSWIVSSVDSAGASLAPDTVIYVRVDKPKPAAAPVGNGAPKTAPKATTPKPAPPRTQQPVAPKPAPPAAVYYKNCAAAKAAGAAPIHRGQPGYGSHLDRDGDGIGCER